MVAPVAAMIYVAGMGALKPWHVFLLLMIVVVIVGILFAVFRASRKP